MGKRGASGSASASGADDGNTVDEAEADDLTVRLAQWRSEHPLRDDGDVKFVRYLRKFRPREFNFPDEVAFSIWRHWKSGNFEHVKNTDWAVQ